MKVKTVDGQFYEGDSYIDVLRNMKESEEEWNGALKRKTYMKNLIKRVNMLKGLKLREVNVDEVSEEDFIKWLIEIKFLEVV